MTDTVQDKAVASPLLRLLAEDADDLTVLSAALQDAVARLGDVAFDKRTRTFTLALNRFRWEMEGASERVRAALQFGGVEAVKSRDLNRGDADAVIAILSLDFEPRGEEDPGGTVLVKLAGGGDIRVDVECIDAVLADLSEAWPAGRAPRHRA